MKTKNIARSLTLALIALLAPTMSRAGDIAPQDFAARTGISFGPDQFNGGLHAQIGTRTAPQIRPAVDVGFGHGGAAGGFRRSDGGRRHSAGLNDDLPHPAGQRERAAHADDRLERVAGASGPLLAGYLRLRRRVPVTPTRPRR